MTQNESVDIDTSNDEETAEVSEESSDENSEEKESPDVAELKKTVGILSRKLSKLEKTKDDSGESKPSSDKKEEKKSDDFGLLQKTYLRSAGVVEEDEVELARDIQKKTGMDWDELVDDDYFKSKLEGLRSSGATAKATSGVRGGAGKSDVKNTSEYWIAKGTPPTREQVPDRKDRVKIARAMMENSNTGGKKFYNE